MDLDAIIHADDIRKLATLSRAADGAGFHTLWVSETSHDSLIQASVVIQHTERSVVGTGITVAFARSPTALAYAAWDLQALSGGRFVLGLGSQVKGHIERRFGMKWESPVAKMKETIEAIRAVWSCWQYGEPLRYEGKFYRISLMTPFFDPGPIERPEIPIYLAGVNKAMVKLAGLLCQGLMVHPFHSLKYLKEVVLPSLKKGLESAGRSREDVDVTVPAFAAVGKDREEIERAKEQLRSQIAFYASTRTYRGVLEASGLGDLSESLHELSLKGKWREMQNLVTDEVFTEFALEGEPDEVAREIKRRYDGMADSVMLYSPYDPSAKWWEEFITCFAGY